jgi:hypothetical protein
LTINAAYHFYAIAADLQYAQKELNKALGHDVDLGVSYSFANFVKLSAGYSYMRGTETMEILQNTTDKRRLHWGWLMLTVTPTFFTTTWNDKKKV